VLPLAIASGAGSGSENSVGRGVIGGMLTATFLAPFLIPMFFVVTTEKLFKSKAAAKAAMSGTGAPEPSGAGAAE
jgi:Cu/Ag efflux pump CusA